MKNTKFLRLAVAAGVSLLPMAAVAQDFQDTNAYLSLAGGANMPESSNVDFRGPSGVRVNGKTAFDTGYIVSGAFGYKWFSGVRSEVEFNFRQADINDIAGAVATGHQQVLGLMGNVLVDMGDYDAFRPYVGIGLGVGWNKWSSVHGSSSATFPTGTLVYNQRDSALQWQAIAGISHALSETLDGFVEYRFIGLQNNKFGATASASASASRHDDRSHNVLAGVRLNF